jgi:hypothetical protein
VCGRTLKAFPRHSQPWHFPWDARGAPCGFDCSVDGSAATHGPQHGRNSCGITGGSSRGICLPTGGTGAELKDGRDRPLSCLHFTPAWDARDAGRLHVVPWLVWFHLVSGSSYLRRSRMRGFFSWKPSLPGPPEGVGLTLVLAVSLGLTLD